MDIDGGGAIDTVNLIYSSTQTESIPFGSTRSWIKEHLWPISSIVEGADLSDQNALGMHLSDIHNIYPSDYISSEVRGTKYFGECGVLEEEPEQCQSPAEGGAADTCSCQEVYTPPASVKGDIARALLYMDLRYDGSDRITWDMRLTDCPRIPFKDRGYLSQLLQWHRDDPPSTEEKERNTQICRNWQGNRNPFVDHPEIVKQLYYEPFPLPVLGERTSYAACDKLPTLPPTAAPNLCDTAVFAGDVYFFLLNSMQENSIGMYTFRELPASFDLYMTDDAWNGTAFVNDNPYRDGTVMLTIPDGGIPAGTPFGYQEAGLSYSEEWESVSGDFSLTTDGEAVFLYCIQGDGEPKPLLAFSYGAKYVAADSVDADFVYNETSTSFPWSLGELGLQNIQPHAQSLLFNSSALPPSASQESLKIAARDPSYWVLSSTTRFSMQDNGSAAARVVRNGMLVSTIVTMAIVASIL
ncbi:MAG: hypothetical protein SGARI_001412 [Bacillariaceae sp.]